MKAKAEFSSVFFRWLNYIALALFAAATVFPFINIIATSFSGRAISGGEVFLWPVDFNLDAYRNLFDDGQLVVAMKNTVFITVAGTAFNMLFTVLCAYPLSKSRLRGRNAILMAVLFTMLFGGGMIPHFLLINALGLVNTYWALWYACINQRL